MPFNHYENTIIFWILSCLVTLAKEMLPMQLTELLQLMQTQTYANCLLEVITGRKYTKFKHLWNIFTDTE